jgi:hypothetical protein
MEDLLSGDPDRSEAAVVAMWNSWNLEENMLAIETKSAMLAGVIIDRIAAIRAIASFQSGKICTFICENIWMLLKQVSGRSLAVDCPAVGSGSSRLCPGAHASAGAWLTAGTPDRAGCCYPHRGFGHDRACA